MSNFILRDGKVIWKGSNALFEILFLCLKKEIIDKAYKYNKNICDFIEALDQEIYGYGCIFVDVKDYFKSKQELLELVFLLKKCIIKSSEKYAWSDEFKKHVYELCENLFS